MKRIGLAGLKYNKKIYGTDGFADAKEFVPIQFDMCQLILNSGKSILGWWTGSGWDGLKVKVDDPVIRWRKIEHS